MWNLFSSLVPPRKINFEYVLKAITSPENYIIINTLNSFEQSCLIKGTLNIDSEEKTINDILSKYQEKIKIIVLYGKNSCDDSVYKKHKQLIELGIGEVVIYSGGLFEWLLLQDIYGNNAFPTTTKVLDILSFNNLTNIVR
jgi:hypothetical protein